MKDRVLLMFIIFDFLFLGTGLLILLSALITRADLTESPNLDNVARNLILRTCPSKAAIVNSVLVFVTFLVSVPAITMPRSRGLLKLTGYLTGVNALFTLVLGLTLWYETLKTRKNLLDIWMTLDVSAQSLLQTKFKCCGYMNSTTPPFVVDNVCPSAEVAAARLGCVFPFSSFANNFLDIIFTTAFGIVGVDTIFILSTTILVKDRKEKARYLQILEKS
ncbi:putative tetraspanin [Golovinomyces cichoracearum]|uniref:Putative tetraspanin n=1 Tax=Golovinomyces cichoracearum TaxID=62708 RepID=A0A420HHD2_9PEZI|nr:putative tetraspanin [Golovinomyces cichoracearum]